MKKKKILFGMLFLFILLVSSLVLGASNEGIAVFIDCEGDFVDNQNNYTSFISSGTISYPSGLWGNNSCYFDTRGDRFRNSTVVSNTQEYGVCMSFNVDSYYGDYYNEYWFSYGGGSYNTSGFLVYNVGIQEDFVFFSNSASGTVMSNDGVTDLLATGTWFTTCVNVNKTTEYEYNDLYFNNSLQSTLYSGYSSLPNGGIAFGWTGQEASFRNGFLGKLDNIIITDRLLASDEIENYNECGLLVCPQQASITENVFITPSNPLTNETLEGYCNISDYEGDEVNAHYIFYVNNISQSSGTYNNISLNQSVNIANLTGLSHEDSVIFSCLGDDGVDNGTFLNSSSVEVTVDDASPSSFAIYNPNGETVTLNSTGVDVYFSWSNASSPVNNSLLYDIALWRLLSTELQTNVNALNYTHTFNNSFNGVYDVVITAHDDYDNETEITKNNAITFCVNDWQEEHTVCSNSTQTRYYIDLNDCPLSYDKPNDDMTIHPCYDFMDSLQNEQDIPRSAWIFVFFLVGIFTLSLILKNGILMFFGGVAIFLIGMFYLPSITIDRLSSVIVALFGVIIMFVSVQLSRKEK